MKLSGGLLAKNALINFGGQGLVAVAALVGLPHITRGLGTDGYGLFALALSLFGSFILLDLGLGRATTKFVAEGLAEKNYEKVGSILGLSAKIQFAIGLVGLAVFLLAIPWVMASLNLAPGWEGATRQTLIYLALSIPFVLVAGAFRGALEGAQAFGIVNVIKVLTNLSTYLLPLLGIALGWTVPTIVLLLLVTRVVGVLAYGGACWRLLPELAQNWRSRAIAPKTVFSIAGWIALTSLLTPILVQIDRLVIGSLVSVSAVSYYQTPYELINGLWMIPTAITAVLFSAASATDQADGERLSRLLETPLKLICATLGPVVILTIVFAVPIMNRWQGGDFGPRSGPVLQWLAAGCLLAAIAWVPSSLLTAAGRPDLIAKGHLVQLPFYLAILWFLTVRFGIVGSAMAFVARVGIDCLWQFVALSSIQPTLRRLMWSVLGRSLALVGAAGVSLWLLSLTGWVGLGLIGVAAIFGILVWQWLLNDTERLFVRGLVAR